MVYSLLLFHVRHWIGDAHVTATAAEKAFWLQPLSFLYGEVRKAPLVDKGSLLPSLPILIDQVGYEPGGVLS